MIPRGAPGGQRPPHARPAPIPSARGREEGALRRTALGIALAALLAGDAAAESLLRLPAPVSPESARGVLYDDDARRIGGARLATTRADAGRFRMQIELDLDSGERQVFEADLEPLEAGAGLRPVWERTRRIGADGSALLTATIDHAGRRARCSRAGREAETLPLDAGDRITNVPLNLLFEPLARGEAEEVRFQWLLCGERSRVLDASARVARWLRNVAGHERVAEIHFRFELGTVLSALFRPFLPRIVFWLDPASDHPWLGHRFPLYPKGPVGIVLRQGVPPAALLDSH